MNLARCQSLLCDAVVDLSHDRPFPLRLRPICFELGVASVKRSDLDGAASILVDASSRPTILINTAIAGTGRERDPFTPWERFLVAHELGHLLLHRSKFPNPNGKSEYWQTEAICDDFARRLLIPDAVMIETISGDPGRASNRLILASEIARLARVPWSTSASRLAGWEKSRIAFFRVVQHERGGYKVVSSTLKHKRGIGQLIKPGTLLWEELSKIDVSKTAVVVEGIRLSGLATLDTIVEGAVSRTGNELRVAIVPYRQSAA